MSIIVNKKRVINLYRVSTERQGSEDDIPVQKSECMRYAEANGWEVVEEITEKISGFNTPIEERDSLYKIRDMAMNGEIDIVVAYMADRIGRQTELAGYIQGLAMLGVQVYTVKEGLIGGLEHNDSLMTYIKFWMAEGESKKTSTRVIDSMKQMNEEGYYVGGHVPYGYKLIDTDEKINSKKPKTLKKLVADEEESIVVKLMFQLACEKGYGAGNITKHLNWLGYSNRGNLFRNTTVSRILRNPVYIGYKRYNTTEKLGGRTKKRKLTDKNQWKLQPYNKDLHIIDEAVFYKVQEIMDSRNRNKKHTEPTVNTPSNSAVLLSGMLVCGKCGKKLLSGFSVKTYKRKTDGIVTKSKVYRYTCPHGRDVKDHGKKHWGSKTIDSIVEKQVINTLEQIDLDKLEQGIDSFQQNQLKEKELELSNLTKTINKKTIALENTNKELELFMMGESGFTKEQLVKLLNNLSEELMELKKKKMEVEEELKASEYTLNDIVSFKERFQNWGDIYNSSDFDTKKMMIASVIKEISLYDNKVHIHFKIGIQEALNQSINESESAEDSVHSGMFKDGELWVSEHGFGQFMGNDMYSGVCSHLNREWNGDINTPLNSSAPSLMPLQLISNTKVVSNTPKNLTEFFMEMRNKHRAVEFIVEVDKVN